MNLWEIWSIFAGCRRNRLSSSTLCILDGRVLVCCMLPMRRRSVWTKVLDCCPLEDCRRRRQSGSWALVVRNNHQVWDAWKTRYVSVSAKTILKDFQLPVCLPYHTLPIGDRPYHEPRMYVIKIVLAPDPFAFNIIDLKADVVGDPKYFSHWRPCTTFPNLTWKICSYHIGWTGERSVPITVASGNRSAISITQIPVPVPMSSIYFGSTRVARWRFPPISNVITWCLISMRSSSACLLHDIRAELFVLLSYTWIQQELLGMQARVGGGIPQTSSLGNGYDPAL